MEHVILWGPTSLLIPLVCGLKLTLADPCFLSMVSTVAQTCSPSSWPPPPLTHDYGDDPSEVLSQSPVRIMHVALFMPSRNMLPKPRLHMRTHVAHVACHLNHVCTCACTASCVTFRMLGGIFLPVMCFSQHRRHTPMT